MITANSRHDTGQLRKVKACELSSLKSVDVFAGRLAAAASSPGGLALVPPWFPIVRILACYDPFGALDRHQYALPRL
jgi:hypothetical protein